MRYLPEMGLRQKLLACAVFLAATIYLTISWQPRYYKLEWDNEGRLIDNPLDVEVPVYQQKPIAWFTKVRAPGNVRYYEKTSPQGLNLKVQAISGPDSFVGGRIAYKFQWVDEKSQQILGTLHRRSEDEWLTDVQFSPDGRYLAIAWSDGKGYLYSTKDLSQLRDISASLRRYPRTPNFPWMGYRIFHNGWRSQRSMKIYFSPTGRYVYYREPDHVTSYRIRWF